MVFNNNSMIIDYTNKDYASLREAMLELAKEKFPDWTDHSPNDLGVVLLELFAYMGDMLFYYQDRIANESYLETAVERRSVINLLRLIGYELRPPMPATAELTLVFDEPPQGSNNTTITIPQGAQFEASANLIGNPITFRYLRPNLVRSLLDFESQTYNGKPSRILKIPVVQTDAMIYGENVGSSDGSPAQRFALARSPLIEDQLTINVSEGNDFVQWQRQNTLLNSLPEDRHYTVRRDGNDVAYIEFGDGRFGAIPNRGYNNIKADYAVGGGLKGNVPANTIINRISSIPGLRTVFNEKAATGGDEAENIATAVKRGPQLFRAQRRAVTVWDYEAHARAFGVGKVLAHAPSWNRIELFVAPRGGGWPTDTLKEDLRNYLEDKRMIGTIVDIRDPIYVNVCMEGTLEIDPYRYSEQVKQQVSEAVAALLAFDNVTFGFTFYISKIYEAIEAIEGVTWVNVDHMRTGNSNLNTPQEGFLSFGWNEIPQTLPVHWTPEGKYWRWSTC
jgi:uncharacterized phage protein gp47/JayE